VGGGVDGVRTKDRVDEKQVSKNETGSSKEGGSVYREQDREVKKKRDAADHS